MAKRIHIRGAAYFITTNVQNRMTHFNEDIFCNIFIDDMAKCQEIKPFNLIGFKINPDHVHIILQPTGSFNISQIMHNTKKVSSLHINQILHCMFPVNPYDKFGWPPNMVFHRRCFMRKYNYTGHHPFNIFDWQKSFDDQLIRTPEELNGYINYLDLQVTKHNLSENKFLYHAESIPTDIVFIGKQKP